MTNTTAHQFWSDLTNSGLLEVRGSAEALAAEAAEYNADVTGDEEGFAMFSEKWFQLFQASYVEMLPIKRQELED